MLNNDIGFTLFAGYVSTHLGRRVDGSHQIAWALTLDPTELPTSDSGVCLWVLCYGPLSSGSLSSGSTGLLLHTDDNCLVHRGTTPAVERQVTQRCCSVLTRVVTGDKLRHVLDRVDFLDGPVPGGGGAKGRRESGVQTWWRLWVEEGGQGLSSPRCFLDPIAALE